MKILTQSTMAVTGAVAMALASTVAFAAEKWDMPMAYSATNFHSEHGVMFADKVKEYTNGEIEITVHPGGSLFGGADTVSYTHLTLPTICSV